MHIKCVIAGAVLWFLCLPAPLFAQTTGAISGTVFDKDGNPVEGAVVKLSGDPLPGGRTVTTSATGQYAFPLIQPGAYTVEVSKAGIGDSKRQDVVEVGKTTTLDIVLGLAVQEVVDVTATRPVIDLRSAEVDANYKAPMIAALPLDRGYAGLFQLIPGVAENRSSIGPAAGGSRQDNTYLIDGVNITNPGFGYLSSEINELDIQEVNIKRAGVSAEFGRTAGVITNAVSRSGTNTLSGIARVDGLANGLIGGFRDPAFRDSLVVPTVSPAIGIGGPFVKDKIFWYGSARYLRSTLGQGRTNKLGTPLPDSTQTSHELYGKITANLSSRNVVNVGYRDRPNTLDNTGLGANTAPTVGTNTDNSTRMATASWSAFPTSRTTIDVRYIYMKEDNVSTPLTVLGFVPDPARLPALNVANLPAMGYYLDTTQASVRFGGAEYQNTQNYRRHEIKGTFTQYLDFGRTNHEIKAGGGYEFGEENLSRLSNGWGDIQKQSYGYRVRYYFSQPAQLGQGTTWSAFVQDNVTVASRFTLNAGVLFDRDAFAQNLPGSGGCPAVTLSGGNAPYLSSGDVCTFMRFPFSSEVQPRLGGNFILRPKVGDKIYANWGRYYAMDQKSSGRSLAPRRIYQYEARFSSTGTLISNVPRASTSTKRVDPAVEPTYNDEVLVGYATPVGSDWTIDTFFMYRNAHNFIEDMPSSAEVWPDTGAYSVANLPCARFVVCQGAVAKRSYKAFTVEVSRRLANKWNADVSYTWSRFEGNFDLDYSGDAVFNTSSFIEDGPGTFVQDPFRFGPLRQDRPHVFKIFATWLPITSLTLGGYFRVQSGTPWAARGQDSQGSSALNYLEQAGSHRNPVWANLDMLASYKLRLNGRTSLIFEARVQNVASNQTQTSTDSVQFLEGDWSDTYPSVVTNSVPNPFFRTGNGFAPPRRMYLAAKLQF